jgi:putative ABC transport system ATP-binding protein
MLNISGYKGDCKERAGELLNEVGITPEKQRRVVTELSGGEQQRVAIARAVASESKIILADEPTGSLDSKNSENIMEIFSEIRGRYNTCIIIVTHSAEIASKCDKVMRMSEGKLSYSETCK